MFVQSAVPLLPFAKLHFMLFLWYQNEFMNEISLQRHKEIWWCPSFWTIYKRLLMTQKIIIELAFTSLYLKKFLDKEMNFIFHHCNRGIVFYIFKAILYSKWFHEFLDLNLSYTLFLFWWEIFGNSPKSSTQR